MGNAHSSKKDINKKQRVIHKNLLGENKKLLGENKKLLGENKKLLDLLIHMKIIEDKNQLLLTEKTNIISILKKQNIKLMNTKHKILKMK